MLTCEGTVHCSEPDCLGDLEIIDSETAECDTCGKAHFPTKWWWQSVECDHAKVNRHGRCANDDCGRLSDKGRSSD